MTVAIFPTIVIRHLSFLTRPFQLRLAQHTLYKMKELLERYEGKRPEIVFEWKDPYSEAEGWVVINSLRGGAAGGGTRMRVGLDKREVESLAKTMEIKFTVSGPQIGGDEGEVERKQEVQAFGVCRTVGVRHRVTAS